MLLVKFIILCCALFGLVTAFRNFPTKGNNIKSDLTLKVVSPPDLKRFLRQNPNAVELKPQQTNTGNTTSDQLLDVIDSEYRFMYTYGYRTCEDQILAIDWMEYRSLHKQNATYTSLFPREGQGGLITFVLLEVDISEHESLSVWITHGGIGQDNIIFSISAYHITEFGWLLNIYGYPEIR